MGWEGGEVAWNVDEQRAKGGGDGMEVAERDRGRAGVRGALGGCAHGCELCGGGGETTCLKVGGVYRRAMDGSQLLSWKMDPR